MDPSQGVKVHRVGALALAEGRMDPSSSIRASDVEAGVHVPLMNESTTNKKSMLLTGLIAFVVGVAMTLCLLHHATTTLHGNGHSSIGFSRKSMAVMDVSSCSPGYYCSETICPAGSYCPAGSSAPILAEVGFYSPNAGANAPISCPAGSFTSTTGQTSCTTCPIGSSCPGGATSTVCVAGTFSSTAGQSSCSTCPVGSSCAGGADNTACPAGSFTSTEGQSTCSSCVAGNYCSGGSSVIACPAGFYCTDGSSAPTACAAGTSSSTLSATSASTCVTCAPGSFTNTVGQASCTTCPVGSSCTGGSNNVVCIPGSFSVSGQSSCTTCPVGSSCAGGADNTVCAPGSFTNTTGQSSCTSCPAGSYCSGGSSVVICPAGSTCPASSPAPLPAPPGYYVPLTGSTTAIICPYGYICTGGGISPTVCPGGYICDDVGLSAGKTGPVNKVYGSYYTPFAVDSPWNVRPINPVLSSFQIPLSSILPAPGYFPTVGGGTYSTGFYFASSLDKPMPVYGSSGGGVNDPDLTVTHSLTIPRWPAGALPATGSDGHLDIFDSVTGIIHSFWQLRMNATGQWRCSQYAWSPIGGTGFGDGAHYYQGARATGVVAAAGIIRLHEINDSLPYYRHALALSLPSNALSNSTTYQFPATSADSNAATTNYGNIPEGALLMLPSNFSSAGMKPDLVKVVETLKRYGAYVVDRNVGTPFAIYVENPTNYSLMAPLSWDNNVANALQAIRKELRQVINATSWVNGNELPTPTPGPNNSTNLLSLRGTWSVTYGPASNMGVFNTWTQALEFPTTPIQVRQYIISTNLYNIVSWAKFQVGQTYLFNVTSIGGATLLMNIVSGSTIVASLSSVGATGPQAFIWPSSGVIKLYANSSVGQPSSVKVLVTKVYPSN